MQLGLLSANQRNSLRSTGPRTENGKARSRGNALRHGLCANPASGVLEDGGLFDTLLARLHERFEPEDPLEGALVHRVAVCLWRLQRCALVDAATSTLSARRAKPGAERIREWIERIGECWIPRMVRLTREEEAVLTDRAGVVQHGGRAYMLRRDRLHQLDDLLDREIMTDAAGVSAMIVMIDDLVEELNAQPKWFRADDCERLAWLLGEPVARLPLNEHDADYPDAGDCATSTDVMIGAMRSRPDGETLSNAFVRLVENRRTTLRGIRSTCAHSLDESYERDFQAAMLLPDTETLDRLLRYEAHADKSLARALSALEKLGRARPSRSPLETAASGQDSVRSSTNSEAGPMPVTRTRSRARVHTTKIESQSID